MGGREGGDHGGHDMEERVGGRDAEGRPGTKILAIFNSLLNNPVSQLMERAL